MPTKSMTSELKLVNKLLLLLLLLVSFDACNTNNISVKTSISIIISM